jgi:hypothetical protein
MPIPGEMKKQEPKNRIKEVLEDVRSYAFELLTLVIDQYGTEALEWTPQTLVAEFMDDFQADIPRVNLDKLLAAINILTTDDFFQRLPRFIQLCNVLTGSMLRPHVFDPADAAECAWGMTEAILLRSPEDDETEELFSSDIRHYLGEVLVDEGIRTPSDLLRLAIYPTSTGEAEFPGALDPAAFAMEFEVQEDRNKEIENMVRERLKKLLQRLEALPLQNGDTSKLVERMQQK